MPAIDLDRIKDQGKNFVDGFTPGQKAMTILGVIAVVLASVAFSHWSSPTDYAPLYANLSGADAGKVTQALDSAGVKWKLTDGGATVLVPSSEVYKQRVALSAKASPPATTASPSSTRRASPRRSSCSASTTSARCRASSRRRSTRSTASRPAR